VLAPGTRDLIAVLDATHQAADALSLMASADLLAIGAFRDASRLYMPYTVLWGRQDGHATTPPRPATGLC
jgi:hypothetical protein